MKSLIYVASLFFLVFFLTACSESDKTDPIFIPNTQKICGTLYVQSNANHGQESCSEDSELELPKNAYVSGFTDCFGKINEKLSFQTISHCNFDAHANRFEIDAEIKLALENNEEVGISLHYTIYPDGTGKGTGTFIYGTGKFENISGSINTSNCASDECKGLSILQINGAYCTDS